jgi:hypothetical protein
MDKRLLEVDPVTGLMTWHSYDSQTDETIISYTADSKPVLELNKAMAKDDDFTKQGIKREFWKYAEIPVEVQLDWLINKGIDVFNKDHTKKVFELVNDPEYQHLKTTSKYHRPKGYG